MCVSPNKIRNPHYSTKSAFGSMVYMDVPCGKCVDCLKRRSRGWTFRLLQEAYDSETTAFVTFTYDDENLPLTPEGYPTLDKRHFQLYMKRLRKRTPKIHKHINGIPQYIDKKETKPKMVSPIKYYLAGEYGTKTHRPHYHAIMFNLPENMVDIQYEHEKHTEIWQLGRVRVDDCSQASIAYTTGYIQKTDFNSEKTIINTDTGEVLPDTRQKEFSLMSKNMGLSFLTPQMVRYLKKNLKNTVKINGIDMLIPRYYKDKVYTEEERKLIQLKNIKYQEEHWEKNFEHLPNYDHEYIQKKIIIHQRNVRHERDKI